MIFFGDLTTNMISNRHGKGGPLELRFLEIAALKTLQKTRKKIEKSKNLLRICFLMFVFSYVQVFSKWLFQEKVILEDHLLF